MPGRARIGVGGGIVNGSGSGMDPGGVCRVEFQSKNRWKGVVSAKYSALVRVLHVQVLTSSRVVWWLQLAGYYGFTGICRLSGVGPHTPPCDAP